MSAQMNSRNSNDSVLISPTALKQQFPLSSIDQQRIAKHRQDIKRICQGDDERLLVIVGPCSIHEPQAVLEYAERLQRFAEQYQDTFKIVMRAYLEKPRSTVGWKGYVYDPSLRQHSDLNEGLIQSRQLLSALVQLDLPLATEILNPILIPYFADMYSWGAIGARTSESQIHREIAAHVPFAVGFKNATDGNVNIALDAIQSASQPHQFFGLNDQGQPAMLQNSGNDCLQVILRGGQQGSNYDRASIQAVRQQLIKRQMASAIIVDCSHGNSQKNADLQPQILQTVVAERPQTQVKGVMIESHLQHGKQSIDAQPLQYGCSVTDACLGWTQTEQALRQVAAQLRQYRQERVA